MGVPKFFNWITKRYPEIVTDLADGVVPEIDNFYLDMNGIVHECTHPSDGVSKRLSLDVTISALFTRLDRLISEIIKPKKVLYLAIDGVAPRAKLNQQRARRFGAAKERREGFDNMIRSGQSLNEEDYFDSNCITPGTEFMEAIGEAIRWYVVKNIRDNPAWQSLQVIVSGHDVPGEGEHKIMQYIREARSKPDYVPNQRHCMYGLDADLIMLGLSTHEPHFTLLREKREKPHTKVKGPTRYEMMYLAVVRNYLEMDFNFGVVAQLNPERLIDDFILLTFLIGNDFLPHLPSLTIGDNAFDLIFEAYKILQRKEIGYIVVNGEINDLVRFEELCAIIGANEETIMTTIEEEHKKFIRDTERQRRGYPPIDTSENLKKTEQAREQAYAQALRLHLGPSAPAPGGRKDQRGRYYFDNFNKMIKHSTSAGFMNDLRKSYLEGLMWCLAYYLKGCVCWTWYFPYHHGPMLMDMTNLTQVASQIDFQLGAPFKPFQQLLGCLPPASAKFLPAPYQWLMTNPYSPIIQFYPLNFTVDLVGKKVPWEGVVLLDFIDERSLLAAEADYCDPTQLTELELARNSFGRAMVCRWDPTVQYQYRATTTAKEAILSGRGGGVSSLNAFLPDLENCQCTSIRVFPSLAPGDAFASEVIPGTTDNLPGFPVLTSGAREEFYRKMGRNFGATAEGLERVAVEVAGGEGGGGTIVDITAERLERATVEVTREVGIMMDRGAKEDACVADIDSGLSAAPLCELASHAAAAAVVVAASSDSGGGRVVGVALGPSTWLHKIAKLLDHPAARALAPLDAKKLLEKVDYDVDAAIQLLRK